MYTYAGHIQATYTLLCVGAHNRPETSPGGEGNQRAPLRTAMGQHTCHFILQAGTHSQTRFGAPVRTARVGEGGSSSPAPPMGPPRAKVAWRSPSEQIWVGGAAHRSRVRQQQHPKTPS